MSVSCHKDKAEGLRDEMLDTGFWILDVHWHIIPSSAQEMGTRRQGRSEGIAANYGRSVWDLDH